MIYKTAHKWYLMPATVLLLGVLAVALYVWTDRINEKQRINYLTLDAIMDVQIHTATFHLWFEEVLGGDPAVNMKEVWEDYDRAMRLVDVLMNGGQSDHGMIPHPIDDSGMRSQAQKIKTLLSSFKTLALVRMQQPGQAGIGSEIDHKFDKVFEQIMVNSAELELIVQGEQVLIQKQAGRLFLGIILVWTFIVISATIGLMNLERRRRASEEQLLSTHEQLLSQAEELKGHREHLTELVDMRTRELTSANRSLTQEVADRKQAEEALKDSQKQLRHLSSMLLSAQEEERRKISRELHDELGQSLTLMKFQMRSVEKQLREDQDALRAECENTLQYMNTVIENVRRLSRDLYPPVIQDLGLTRALRWMADNFTKSYGIRLVLDGADIDSLFSKNAQMSIYRIVQEALTNIVKHSGAGSARVVIRRGRGSVAVFIEDDGKGFQRSELAALDSESRGLGLASMEERVGMLGGSLSLWSEQGRGTHISFSIPVAWTSPEGKKGLAQEVFDKGSGARSN
jgi:signal transduction histidine kinase